MVAAGMTPRRSSSPRRSNSAEFLRLDDVGTVAAGKSADFLVLDANPLDDITNTRKIAPRLPARRGRRSRRHQDAHERPRHELESVVHPSLASGSIDGSALIRPPNTGPWVAAMQTRAVPAAWDGSRDSMVRNAPGAELALNVVVICSLG